MDPTIIMNGSKIILMEIANVKFIDSLNYFHMPLSSLPKAYGLNEIEKGVFPHLFNTPENQSYEGPFPPLDVYSPDSMNGIMMSGIMSNQRVVVCSIFKMKL